MRNETPLAALSAAQKYQILEYFRKSYFDTDQDASDFAEEFFFVAGLIESGQVPSELAFLSDWQEGFQRLMAEFASEHTINSPIVETPVGALRATSVRDKDFPGVAIKFKKNGSDNFETLVVMEHSQVKGLRILGWENLEDDEPSIVVPITVE